MYLDDNGITVYEVTDNIDPLQTLLNAGMTSVSDLTHTWNRVYTNMTEVGTEIPSPTDGMEIYTTSDNTKWIYQNGWKRVPHVDATEYTDAITWTEPDWSTDFTKVHLFGPLVYISMSFTYSGSTLTANSAANFGDTYVARLNSRYGPVDGVDQDIVMTVSGVKAVFGRIRGSGSNQGQIDLTHAAFPGEELNSGDSLRINLSYMRAID